MCPLEMARIIRITVAAIGLISTIIAWACHVDVRKTMVKIKDLDNRGYFNRAKTLTAYALKVQIAEIAFALLSLTAIGFFIGADRLSGIIN